MRITFLIQNFYGVGGTNTAVHNLAAALSVEHQVEVVSVFRRQDDCPQPVDGLYEVTSLVDVRSGQPDARDPRRFLPSTLVPTSEEIYAQYSVLTDERLKDFLRRTPSDVVIGTRPSLNLVLASHGSRRYLKLSQEHMTQDLIDPRVKDAMLQSYSALDACICLTVADAQALGRDLGPVARPFVVAIPNGVPAPTLDPSACSSPIVMAAGRLADVKRYDILVRAFALLAPGHPRWTLRLYGAGPEGARLRRLVQSLGLDEQVLLMGRAVPLGTEWVKGSIAVSTSSHESFGMTIVEAMRHGLPVVSTDCPVGPSEIIRDGHDGYLVPVDDVEAVAAALARLMDDDDQRVAMGAAAAASSVRFDPMTIQQTYTELLTSLAARGRGSAAGRLSALGRFQHRTLASVGRRAPRRFTRLGRDGESPALTEPSSDVVVTTRGDVVIRAGAAPEGSVVVVRPRDGSSDPVRSPFVFVDSEGWQATIPVAALGCEGRWNAYLEHADGSRRLRPGTLDTRRLAEARPACGHREPLAPVAVPYATRDGYLAIRTWIRPRHAECTSITLQDDRLRIGLSAFGVALGRDATLQIQRRGPHPTLVTAGVVTEDGNTGWSELDFAELVAQRLTRHDDWDVWLHPTGEADPVRVARFMDDVVDRKAVYVQPLLTFDPDEQYPWVEEDPRSTIRVRPYFAADSGLSLFVAESY